MATGLRVHLDHLINRQSLRYRSKLANSSIQSGSPSAHRSDSSIRFDDIRQKDGWFDRLVKPDFQRATCAWDSEACVTFLSSVIRRRIIPSIILWRSSENGLVYVLDGAHRLSVLRAWMIDDWGDKAGDFYEKNENLEEIQAAAQSTRALVKASIGLFSEFEAAHAEWKGIARKGGAPRLLMPIREFDMAMFHSDMVDSSRTLHAQWEDGNYDAAEESFLAINRQGERLDDVEQLLIEHRNGSLSRVIMSIASAGASGHYWPEPPDAKDLPQGALEKLVGFNDRCGALHNLLFVPPFDAKILDINVPFLVAPGHFRPHQHLIELLPLLTENGAVGGERLPQLLSRDAHAEAQEIIVNANQLLTQLEKKLGHLGGRNTGSLSLSLVPLIYWYNRKANFVRGLFYGWCHWLLTGDDTQVQERKLAVSAVRGELEDVLIRYKDEVAEVQHRAGAGLKSLSSVGALFQKLVETLLLERGAPAADRDEKIRQIVGAKPPSRSKAGASRSFSKGSRIEINVRELLNSAIKCEICGGVVDLKQGLQYDHKHEYANGGRSVAENGRPTHPFCNLFRDRITQLRIGNASIRLPNFADPSTGGRTFVQLNLFDSFPGE
ncbi:HNH endonuclease signature motif containing protein [Burkholderia cepacia]|uniref:HNH endonuclease signature motif containing protein n=1 Tax=Burkholderia cepacia TaxID=292 RepID=UPI002AB5E263|nr:HNH endonuclease signature motif containing protein [Burkholderia cepacia]